MPDNERVEQFRKMAEDDPNNELGHFSLGRAYLDAGQHQDAARALQRALAINPKISKAWQLLAEAQLAQNQRDLAIETLTTGIKTAHARGEPLPKNAMIAKLQELGAPVPELTSAAAPPAEVGEGQILCHRCGRAGPKLQKPPFRTPFGQEIFDRICQPCWREAIGMGTKVINELRLPMSDPHAQKVWDQHIREFLNL